MRRIGSWSWLLSVMVLGRPGAVLVRLQTVLPPDPSWRTSASSSSPPTRFPPQPTRAAGQLRRGRAVDALTNARGTRTPAVEFEHVDPSRAGGSLARLSSLLYDEHLRDIAGADVAEHPTSPRPSAPGHRAGGIDHVQQQVGVGGFLQRGLEGVDQLVRQVADEAHGVGQRRPGAPPRRCRRGAVVSSVANSWSAAYVWALHERVEQRGLAGVRVADERDAEGAAAVAGAALRAALLLHAHEALVHGLDALADHAAVEFRSGLHPGRRSADTAALALQVAPPAHQARGQVLQLGEFDLQLALVALRARARRSRGSGMVRSATATPRCRSRLRCCAGDKRVVEHDRLRCDAPSDAAP